MKLTIAHLYPAEMNIYGDRGNIIALSQRLHWRGIRVQVEEIEPKTRYDLRQADIIFGGGGQDRGQAVIADDLQKRSQNLHDAIEAGAALLAICGTYQLLGSAFQTAELTIPGVNIFKLTTVASQHRMIGNVVVDSPFGELVGFENHSGQTELEPGQEPLGKVLKGFGNNDHSAQEGAVYKNAIGTYLHGPVLPKNPQLADELIRRALKRRYGNAKLQPLNDTLEAKAAAVAKTRPQ